MILLTFNKNPPIHYLNKLEYFIRPIIILFFCELFQMYVTDFQWNIQVSQ